MSIFYFIIYYDFAYCCYYLLFISFYVYKLFCNYL